MKSFALDRRHRSYVRIRDNLSRSASLVQVPPNRDIYIEDPSPPSRDVYFRMMEDRNNEEEEIGEEKVTMTTDFRLG